MKRKLISIIVSLFFTGVLSACGGSESIADKSTKEIAVMSETEASAQDAEILEMTQDQSGPEYEERMEAESVWESEGSTQAQSAGEGEKGRDVGTSSESEIDGEIESAGEGHLSAEAVKGSEENTGQWSDSKETSPESDREGEKTEEHGEAENSSSVSKPVTTPATKPDTSTGSDNSVPDSSVPTGSGNFGSKPSMPTDHTCNYGPGVETIKAGCETTGVMIYTCSCGKTKTETIEATGHDIVFDSKAATCEENGYERKYCGKCDHVESDTTINATGHTEGGVEYFTAEPFCTRTAYGWYVCAVCGKKYDAQTFPELGHDPVQYNYRAGNCMQVAMWDVKCDRCEERMEFDVKGATDPDVHNYVTVTLKEWDDALGDIVEYQVIRCSWCFKEQ